MALIILRNINPSPMLGQWLRSGPFNITTKPDMNQIIELEDPKTGRVGLWIDDRKPRDSQITDLIMEDGVTIGFGVFDSDTMERYGWYRDLGKAVSAVKGAKIVFKTDVDLADESEDEEDEEPESVSSPDAPVVKRPRKEYLEAYKALQRKAAALGLPTSGTSVEIQRSIDAYREVVRS